MRRRIGSAADRIDPWSELALLEHPHHLEALDRRIGRLHRLEAERGFDQPLQFPVVALQPVVEILHLSVTPWFDQDAMAAADHAHDLEALDRGVSGLHRLEAPWWDGSAV